MTALAEPLLRGAGTDFAKARTLGAVVLSTWAVLLLVSGQSQIIDPFLRHDDFPALLLRAEDFYSKTLEEGRWINYWWHLRPVPTPAWLNYQVYMLGWAIFAAAAALHVFGTSMLRYPMLLAALIVLSPQATLISLWFNTLIPGVWLIATYAVLTLWLSPLAGRVLLLLFVPASLLTYSTHPLMLLAVCLVRQDQRRSLRDLVGLMLVFMVSLALGLLLIYSLNWFTHGVFGIRLAGWRNASPAESLEDLLDNLPIAQTSLAWVFKSMGFNNPWLMTANTALGLASLVLLFRLRLSEAFYISAGAVAGLALLSLHALQQGVQIPSRATAFVWVCFCVAIVRAADVAGGRSERAAQLALVVVVSYTITLGGFAQKYYRGVETWQAATRHLATLVPPGTDQIYLYGSQMGIAGAVEAQLQDALALRFRLEYLTGAAVISCYETATSCQDTSPPFDPRPMRTGTFVVSDGATTYIRLPAIDLSP